MGIHLDFYNHCMKTGELPFEGLCICAHRDIISKELLDLFEPSEEEIDLLAWQQLCTTMWASGCREEDVSDECMIGFTPLRQAIVLLMAAMNNEL